MANRTNVGGTRAGTYYGPPGDNDPAPADGAPDLDQPADAGAANDDGAAGGNPGDGGDGGAGGGGGAGGEGNGQPGGGEDANAQAFVFSLTPGQAAQGIINYNTKVGATHYKNAISKLEAELYDCSQEGFYQFIKSLKERADAFGWSRPGGILWVAPDNKQGTAKINVLENYGVISLERITEHETTYVNSPTRAAQDDRMFYECMMNSITIEGKAKLNMHEGQYKIGEETPSGLCLFKVLVRESYLDSKATANMIRSKLSSLDLYLPQVGNDIIKFNAYVTTLMDALHARGEQTHDLLNNLFRAYAACSDGNFVKYISDRQSEWEDGAELTAQQLMLKAVTKFKTLQTKEIWEAPTKEQERLIALEAVVDSQKKKISEMKKSVGRKRATGKNDDSGSGKRPKSDDNKKGKPEWMSQKPKDEDLKKSREWNRKQWYFCGKETGGKCAGVWRQHKPTDCKGTAFKGRKSQKGGKNYGKKKTVTLQQAELEKLAGEYSSDTE